MKKGEGVSSDNETQEFEGLTIDILEEMRKELGFNYKIHLVQDGKFGVKDESTNEWNGVVKEIIDKVNSPPTLSLFTHDLFSVFSSKTKKHMKSLYCENAKTV